MTMTGADGRLDQPLYGAGLLQAIRRFYRNYAVFSGRASRSEYWLAVLFFVLVYAVLGIVLAALVGIADADPTATAVIASVVGGIAGIIFLGSIVPSIAVQVRRLHDANLSGGLYFLHLVPYAGSLAVLILTILPSNPLGARFDLGAVGSPFAPAGSARQTPPPPSVDDRRV